MKQVFSYLSGSIFSGSVLSVALLAGSQAASAQNPGSAQNPFLGSVTAATATDETLRLTLDDAIVRGLKNNLGLKESEASERSLHGQKNEALQMFLPAIQLSGGTGVYEHNLVANGFTPGTIKKFASLLGMGSITGFSPITKDDLTQGNIYYSQMLFSGPVIAAFKAAGAAENAAHFARTSARGEVVQQVATAYLHAIAAASEVRNAEARVRQAELLADHARAAHEAGVVANLDDLRAQVQLKAQQQTQTAAENAYEKSLILLKREIGVAPGQKIELSDPAPYNELTQQTPVELLTVAYKNRQDYQKVQNEAVEAKSVTLAYKAQRLPSLSFNGYYGTATVNGAGTRGNFAAVGTVTMPLFREAGLRGDVAASQAQQRAVEFELADLRGAIEYQVRSALLDVDATHKLVEVARSNVELATRTVSDETERVNAGVDDNLPLVTAQATLATAENNMVESLFQYNVAKLVLARSTGLLETTYRDYLGR
ncbi:MAG: TolC family protein [Terracidiphilus sp.]|nr:TolC family protein [Terracidiphilus sp.]